MVSEEAYAALQAQLAEAQAENSRLQERVADLSAQLAAALQQIGELESAKQGPPPFVKANVPERPPKQRRKRAPEHHRARRREEPTQIVEWT